jgi:hypothetical protein
MTYTNQIKRLYNIAAQEMFGFAEAEIAALEARLSIVLPETLRQYYLTLGKNEQINFSHNRLLKPGTEIGFSNDRYLVFYEENQVVCYWGIKESDLKLDNPPVYGNYSPNDANSAWYLESETTEGFLLLMAIYNGTLGGLKYNANNLEPISTDVVKYIESKWTIIPEIDTKGQQTYTDNFEEVISLSFNGDRNCTGIFIGTSDRLRFDNLLRELDVDWSYTSYEDDDE